MSDETSDVTLVELLRARLSEREAALREIAESRSWPTDSFPELIRGDMLLLEHAEYDAARVLRRLAADVEAKRRIIEAVERWQHNDPDHGGFYACPLVPGSLASEREGLTECECGLVARRQEILGLLALPDADHPDYREEWKP